MAVNDEYPTEHLDALSGIIVHVSPFNAFWVER